jgi:putative transposase
LIRQSFIFDKIYLNYDRVYYLVKDQPDYQALPRKVSQQVLKVLDKNWKSFFLAFKSYQKNPLKFTGRPKLPQYKHKSNGRNLLIYTIQAVSKTWLKQGKVKLSGCEFLISTNAKNIAQVRLVPKIGQYVIEVIYEGEKHDYVNNPTAIAAINL